MERFSPSRFSWKRPLLCWGRLCGRLLVLVNEKRPVRCRGSAGLWAAGGGLGGVVAQPAMNAAPSRPASSGARNRWRRRGL